MDNIYNSNERRSFTRIDYLAPLAYKVCRQETLSMLLKGYTSNISQSGILCNIREKVNKDDILWLSFDRAILKFCEELEKRSLIYQNGVIGRVVRVDYKDNATYDIGIQFITREERNLTNIYSKD